MNKKLVRFHDCEEPDKEGEPEPTEFRYKGISVTCKKENKQAFINLLNTPMDF